MLPIFARGKKRKFCTRMAIHCRLRRTPGEAGITLSVRDINEPEVHLEGHTKHIPLTNAFEFVEKKMMECVALFDKTGSGIVSDKILVLEVRHPHVATIDLIDLPGSCTLPDNKAKDIRAIHEYQVAQDKKNGNLAMYLAVVMCTTIPTNSETIKFLKDHNLLEKSFGVFTKCDKLHEAEDFRTLEGWITGIDHDDPAGGGGVVDGHVKLGGGWTATSLKAPEDLEDPEYFTVHSIERLNIQKHEEKEFFKSHPVLLSLYERNLCGVAALVAKIEPAHDRILHGEFKKFTMKKIGETVQKHDLELRMLGSVGKGDEVKNNMARAEVKRRLSLVLSKLKEKFQLEFLKGKVGEPLVAILSGSNNKVWKSEEVDDRLKCLRKEVEGVVSEAICSLPSQWLQEISDILTATIMPKKNVEASAAGASGGGGGGWNLGFSAMSYGIIGNIFNGQLATRMGLYQAIKEAPVFQLCAYEVYTTHIVKKCEGLLKCSAESIKTRTSSIVEHGFSMLNPQWLQLVPNSTYSTVTVKIDAACFANAIVVSFIQFSPSESSLSKSYVDIEVGGMNPRQLAECLKLEAKIRDLYKARDSVVRALNISVEEVNQFENEVTWEELEDEEPNNTQQQPATAAAAAAPNPPATATTASAASTPAVAPSEAAAQPGTNK
jgi:hypothetical protein